MHSLQESTYCREYKAQQIDEPFCTNSLLKATKQKYLLILSHDTYCCNSINRYLPDKEQCDMKVWTVRPFTVEGK
jgi:hypothetical protein